MGVIIELSGLRFGRLVVVSLFGFSNDRQATWSCKCDCGSSVVVVSGHLRSGNTKSCGCLSRELTSERRTTHGMCSSPEYRAWQHMKDRCNNKNDKRYMNYGGRGISVCDRWINSFDRFFEDVGARPTKGHSIDRKNNDGNYDPDNCRWATATEQNRNQRIQKNNKTGVVGVWQKGKGKWCAYIYTGRQIHLGTYSDFSDAVVARRIAELKYWSGNGKQ